MQSLTSDQLALLIFDNSLVSSMHVDQANKTLKIVCDRAFLDQGDEAVEIHNVTIEVSAYDSLQARIYNDEEFETVEASDAAFHLAELCEWTHEGGKTMISGFSNQEGSWSDYTAQGGTFSVSHS